MRTKRFSESQILDALQQVDAGRLVKDVCRDLQVTEKAFEAWRARYGRMEAADLRRLREIEAEHGKLKRLYAELALENSRLKELIAKKP